MGDKMKPKMGTLTARTPQQKADAAERKEVRERKKVFEHQRKLFVKKERAEREAVKGVKPYLSPEYIPEKVTPAVGVPREPKYKKPEDASYYDPGRTPIEIEVSGEGKINALEKVVPFADQILVKREGRIEPTFEDREIVGRMYAMGITKKQIAATTCGGISVGSLDKHFKYELETSVQQANFAVAESLYKKAVGGDTNSMLFWLKTRAGWKETSVLETTFNEPPKLNINFIKKES